MAGGLVSFSRVYQERQSAPYLISCKENPSHQLLLIRVKWSQPTISYWTPKKSLLPLFVFVPSSLPACSKFRLQGGEHVARGT